MTLFHGYRDDSPMSSGLEAGPAAIGVEHWFVDQHTAAHNELVLRPSPMDGSTASSRSREPVFPSQRSTASYCPAADQRRPSDVRETERATASEPRALVSGWTSPLSSGESPLGDALHASKPFQAQAIAAAGLDVPTTLITTDPDTVREFWATHGSIVFKSISGIRSIVQQLEIKRAVSARPSPKPANPVPGDGGRGRRPGPRRRRACVAAEMCSDAVDYRYATTPALRRSLDCGRPAGRARQARASRCHDSLDLPFSGIDLRRYLLLEVPRAAWDLQRLVLLGPWLRLAPAGDGHPVLVVPGFLGDDVSTGPLRAFLRSLGYPAYGWRLGRNIGPTEDVVDGLRWSLDRLTEMHGAKISIIGCSLGGIIAREVGRIAPDKVRQVISLGSPFALEDPRQSRVGNGYERYRELHSEQYRLGEGFQPSREPLAIPSTAIYTRHDGVVAWHTCAQRVDERSENVEVTGGHIGLGHHPAALLAASDRLSQPEDDWRPFRPPLLLRHWYPTPVQG